MNPLEAAFVADIIANPNDDTPRLVFADWLEENGQPERGRFIRIQCRLAELEIPERLSLTENEEYNQRHFDEREFIIEHGIDKLAGSEWTPSRWEPLAVKRGFVEAITCSTSNALYHVDTIRTLTPLREVTLTTMPEADTWPGIANASVWRLVGDPLSKLFSESELFSGEGSFDGGTYGWLNLRLLELRFPGIKFNLPNTGESTVREDFTDSLTFHAISGPGKRYRPNA